MTNALLLGVGGIALYGALKPGDTKTIYINNSTNPADARDVSNNGTHYLVSGDGTTIATPLAAFPVDCSIYKNVSVPPQMTTPNATMQQPIESRAGAAPLATEPTTLSANITDATTVTSGMMMTNGTETTTAGTGETMTTEAVSNSSEAKLAEFPTTTTIMSPTTQAVVVPVPAVPFATAPKIPDECMPYVTGQKPWPEYQPVTPPTLMQTNNNQQQSSPQGTNFPVTNWGNNDQVYAQQQDARSTIQSSQKSGSVQVTISLLTIAFAALLAN